MDVTGECLLYDELRPNQLFGRRLSSFCAGDWHFQAPGNIKLKEK